MDNSLKLQKESDSSCESRFQQMPERERRRECRLAGFLVKAYPDPRIPREEKEAGNGGPVFLPFSLKLVLPSGLPSFPSVLGFARHEEHILLRYVVAVSSERLRPYIQKLFYLLDVDSDEGLRSLCNFLFSCMTLHNNYSHFTRLYAIDRIVVASTVFLIGWNDL
ncbi:hypothetical protein KPH14_006384 [Odynerus spinipes]|uniref:Uncharacterized protein n=1 Tax=Odynerus spinipes TaxID=1348599 RepID=A0AAD9RZ41_9HYME|nr:hypothetical protein KPH14_006384 [Odynerus spinipes]